MAYKNCRISWPKHQLSGSRNTLRIIPAAPSVLVVVSRVPPPVSSL